MYYHKVLSNGIRVIGEKIPHFRSVSMGVWIGAGSSLESDSNNGISHFIEHMMFKGTQRRNSQEIASVIDSVGGQLNAFTSKECTCYYVKIIDEHLRLSFDLLSDMLLNSIFDVKEMEKEKGVILEEINMVEDSPEDLVHDILAQTFFKGHPLSYPILGSQNNVSSFSRNDILEYMSSFYTPDNVVISFAGNYNEDQIEDWLEKYFGDWHGSMRNIPNDSIGIPQRTFKIREKDTEQTHICFGTKGLSQNDKNLYALLVLNNVLGGGMSSRLFQKIREERGLAYSVYSYPSSYKNSGMFSIYAGMKPSQAQEVIHLIVDEIAELKIKGINDQEFRQSKEQLKGNYMLGLESTSSRMSSLGKSELLLRKVYSPSDILERIDKVNIDDVQEVIGNILDIENASIAVVGKVAGNLDLDKALQMK